MKIRIIFPLVLAVLGIQSGCVSAPKQEFDLEANHHIRSVTTLTRPEHEEYTADILHHPATTVGGSVGGLIGGLIGATIAMNDMKINSKRFITAMSGSSKPETNARIIEGLREGLADSNKQFVTNHVLSEEYKQKFADDVTKFTDGADAYVDIIVTHSGYMAKDERSPYEPYILVKVRVIDARSKALLYESHIHYSNINALEDTKRILPGPENSYADIDELVANADKAREGLRVGAKSIGLQIAADLTP